MQNRKSDKTKKRHEKSRSVENFGGNKSFKFTHIDRIPCFKTKIKKKHMNVYLLCISLSDGIV